MLEITFNQIVLYLRPYTSDADVYLQVFKNEDYKSLVEIYQQIYSDNADIIFDCGGNIGFTSIYLKQFFPNANFVVIEPFIDNIEILKLNFDLNKINNAEIIRGGVWNRNCNLQIKRDFRDGKEWSIVLNETNSLKNIISGISISDLISKYTCIDILKIDIEGSEKILFQDLEYCASFLKKVKCIAIEIHDEFDCRELIYQRLIGNNFFYFDILDLTIGINKNYMQIK